jgi:hypothetical protein
MLKSNISLNINKVFKAMSFTSHAHVFHSRGKEADNPTVLGQGDISFFEMERNLGLKYFAPRQVYR